MQIKNTLTHYDSSLKKWLLIFSIFLISCCQTMVSQENTIRQAAYAGEFYPADKYKLEQQLERYFSGSAESSEGTVRGLVSPHAGYVYSGEVAAAAYQQLSPSREIENVFILAPAHHVRINYASVYCGAAYQTPLGELAVNNKITEKLIASSSLFAFNEKAHNKEHSIEVQLPFLQHHLDKPFKIVPVLINASDRDKLEEIAKKLQPYYQEENLFVVSTDFSHYPDYEHACRVDSLTGRALSSGDTDSLYKQINDIKKAGVSNLKTLMCGLGAMTVMLFLAKSGQHHVRPVEYQNSGMSRYGNRNRVVGYWAMSIENSSSGNLSSSGAQNFQLSRKEKRQLLDIARTTLETYLKKGQIPEIDYDSLSENLKTKTGCFVTLNKDHQLRGCIGGIKSPVPLAEEVQQKAISAALEDPRFPGVTAEELSEISIELSVLTPLKRIHSLDEFNLGQEGILIKKGSRTGVYLPQVAEKRDWTKEEFVNHCAQHKAGLGKDGWKDAELYTFRALVFSENNLNDE
ncbi:MAG: AmmeMemoRadiSam system protein B [Bacteroidales bacterium]|nr:AmmeMemoRadiSam system protein B [Bacteroidales bacterium]MCF8327607.1 AmmeMemoRadiSam system protein B [Bacteroidales bacterium]